MAGGFSIGRVVNKASASMSLNERFHMLRQKAVQNAFKSNANQVNRRVNARQFRQGSVKNRRLALQMANRPNVVAALRQNNNFSVKSRLGTRVTTRVTNRFRGAATAPTRRRPLNRAAVKTVNRGAYQGQRRRRGGFNNVNNQVVNAQGTNRRPIRRFGNFANRGTNRGGQIRGGQTRGGQTRGGQIRRGFRQRKQVNQNDQAGNVKPQNKRRFRINRNFGQRFRNQQNRRRGNPRPNKEQLDNDLDTYMARTKTGLDAEIDAYMLQAW